MSNDPQEKRQLGDRVAQSLDNPWIVLVLLFFVLAAFGIPLIWLSRAFPTWGKIVLSIVVTLYTILILWVVCIIMLWCYHRIVQRAVSADSRRLETLTVASRALPPRV